MRKGLASASNVAASLPWVFAVVTQLEMVMADAIRREFDGGNGWLERLCRRHLAGSAARCRGNRDE